MLIFYLRSSDLIFSLLALAQARLLSSGSGSGSGSGSDFGALGFLSPCTNYWYYFSRVFVPFLESGLWLLLAPNSLRVFWWLVQFFVSCIAPFVLFGRCSSFVSCTIFLSFVSCWYRSPSQNFMSCSSASVACTGWLTNSHAQFMLDFFVSICCGSYFAARHCSLSHLLSWLSPGAIFLVLVLV
jgi:hypothetical protein